MSLFPDFSHEDSCPFRSLFPPSNGVSSPPPTTYYVGQSGATSHVTRQSRSTHRIWAHLRTSKEIKWQILCLIPIDFRTPTRMTMVIESRMITKLRKVNPGNEFISDDPAQFFTVIHAAPHSLHTSFKPLRTKTRAYIYIYIYI